MKPGDSCRITLPIAGVPTTLDAVVHMVNSDGRAAAVAVDAIVEGFAGWLPLLWRDGKAYTFGGTLVEVEPL